MGKIHLQSSSSTQVLASVAALTLTLLASLVPTTATTQGTLPPGLSIAPMSPGELEDFQALQAADVVLAFSNREVRFEPSGDMHIKSTLRYMAQNENGRVALGQREIYFDPSVSTVKVISAATLNKKVRTPVPLDKIVTRSVSDSTVGIENRKKVIVPFSDVQNRSVVEIIYEQTVKTHVPGVAMLSLQVDPEIPQFAVMATISSPKKISVHSIGTRPTGVPTPPTFPSFMVEQKAADDGSHITQIRSTMLMHLGPKLSRKLLIEKDDLPTLFITSADNWSAISSPLAQKYHAASSQPLPKEFEAIRNLASQEKTDRLKLDRVHHELSKLVSYSGNWVDIEGMFFPRGHKDVVAEKKGDCKDFATSIVAIARSLGFKADIALVHSSPPNFRMLRDSQDSELVPSSDYFNHAIAKITGADGQVYWVDGTRSAPNSGNIWQEIAGSPALVLATDTKNVERIPELNTGKSHTISIKRTVSTDPALSQWKGTLETTGELGPGLLETLKPIGLQNADQAMSSILIGALARQDVPLKSLGEFLNAPFQDYENLKYSFQTTGSSALSTERSERLLTIGSPAHIFLGHLPSLRENTGVHLGTPKTIMYETTFEGITTKDVVQGDCFVKSEWLDVERRVDSLADKTIVTDKIQIKKHLITSTEAKDEVFLSVFRNIGSCYGGSRISLNPMELPKHADALHPAVKKLFLAPAVATEKNTAKEAFSSGLEAGGQYLLLKSKRIFEEATAANPEDVESHLFRFRILRTMAMLRGDIYNTELLKFAEDEASELIKKYPQEAQYLVTRGITRTTAKNLDGALADLSQAYRIQPNDFLVRRTMAVILNDKKHPDAEKWLQSSLSVATIKDSPQDTRRNLLLYWSTKTEIASDNKDTQGELTAHEKLVELDPDSPWTIHNYANALSRAKQFDKAIEMSRKALKVMDFGAARSSLAGSLIQKALASKKDADDTSYALKPENEKLMLEAKEIHPNGAYVNFHLVRFYYSKSIATQESDWLDNADLYAADGLKANPGDPDITAMVYEMDRLKGVIMRQLTEKGIKPTGRWPASWSARNNIRSAPMPPPMPRQSPKPR